MFYHRKQRCLGGFRSAENKSGLHWVWFSDFTVGPIFVYVDLNFYESVKSLSPATFKATWTPPNATQTSIRHSSSVQTSSWQIKVPKCPSCSPHTDLQDSFVYFSPIRCCEDGWVGFAALSPGSLSFFRLWCSVTFSFIQVQLPKIHTVKSTKFLLHVNISIFFPFFCILFYTLSSLLLSFFFFCCLQLWPQVLKVLESGPVKPLLRVLFDPDLVRVRSSSDVIRSGLYMALGL